MKRKKKKNSEIRILRVINYKQCSRQIPTRNSGWQLFAPAQALCAHCPQLQHFTEMSFLGSRNCKSQKRQLVSWFCHSPPRISFTVPESYVTFGNSSSQVSVEIFDFCLTRLCIAVALIPRLPLIPRLRIEFSFFFIDSSSFLLLY